MVGTSEAMVMSLGSLGPFLRTFRRSRCLVATCTSAKLEITCPALLKCIPYGNPSLWPRKVMQMAPHSCQKLSENGNDHDCRPALPFVRTCRQSRYFDCKVHKCETWNSLPHFALLQCCQLARAEASTYGWNRKCQSVAHAGQTGWEAPLGLGSWSHELCNGDWSILFHSCPGQMKYCKEQHQQLTLAWSICSTSNARMKLTCFRDVSNTRHMLVTSHQNHSDAFLWQPFWGMVPNLLTVFSMPAAAQWGARMGSLIFVMLSELGPDLWRKGRVQHGLVIPRFDLARRLKHRCIAAGNLMSRKVEA